MPLLSTPQRWGSVMKALHWLVALAVIALAIVGWWMKGLPVSPDKVKVYALHKSVGLTVLALVLVRLAWRTLVDRRRPPLPPGMPHAQRFAAHASHVLLYLALLAMALSGWLFNSAANFPLRWFGLFSVPSLSAPDPELKALAGAAHWWLFWVIAAVFAVHAGAALWHHFARRDDVLLRMLPFARLRAEIPPPPEPPRTETPT